MTTSLACYSMESEKDKTLKIVNSYKFQFHKRLANRVQCWACSQKSCTAFLKTDVNGDVQCHLNHSYVALSANDHVSNVVRLEAINNTCERPAKILHRTTLVEGAFDCGFSSADVECIRHNTYSAGSKEQSKLPTTLAELHLVADEWVILKKSPKLTVLKY